MAESDIVTLRVGGRLVHGQGQLWIKTLGINTVIVTNDSASEDPMQQTLMEAVVPKTIVVCFFLIRHTCGMIMRVPPKQVILIMCKTTGDVLKLVAGGVPVKEINVDNIHHAPGKGDVSKYITLGEDGKAVLRKMRNQCGITFNARTTASGDDGVAEVDLSKYL